MQNTVFQSFVGFHTFHKGDCFQRKSFITLSDSQVRGWDWNNLLFWNIWFPLLGAPLARIPVVDDYLMTWQNVYPQNDVHDNIKACVYVYSSLYAYTYKLWITEILRYVTWKCLYYLFLSGKLWLISTFFFVLFNIQNFMYY